MQAPPSRSPKMRGYPCRATRDGCEAHLLICRQRKILTPSDFRLARCTRRSLRYVARTFGTNGTGTQTFAYPRADGANELAHQFLPENLSHQTGTEKRSLLQPAESVS